MFPESASPTTGAFEMMDESVAVATESASTGRRAFLRNSALTALLAPVAVGALASCTAVEEEPGKAAAGSTPAPPKSRRELADEMDRLHEAGVKAFPAKTAGKGNQLMAPVMDGRVKVYRMRASEIQWETEPGKKVTAWAYNDQVPGPQIRVKQGDRVRFVLHNQLPESTAVHFHGVELPNDQDGVPYITQPPVKPGESFTYEFTVPNSGTHMYHSHHNSTKQVGLGLLGAFIVAPNRTLQKAGFKYLKTHMTVPGPFNFHQAVTRWVIER